MITLTCIAEHQSFPQGIQFEAESIAEAMRIAKDKGASKMTISSEDDTQNYVMVKGPIVGSWETNPDKKAIDILVDILSKNDIVAIEIYSDNDYDGMSLDYCVWGKCWLRNDDANKLIDNTEIEFA